MIDFPTEGTPEYDDIKKAIESGYVKNNFSSKVAWLEKNNKKEEEIKEEVEVEKEDDETGPTLEDMKKAWDNGEVGDSFESKKLWLEKWKKDKKKDKSIIEEEVEENKKTISILDLFEGEYTQTNSAFKLSCPSCGMQGGRTEGFILFPDGDTAYCHSSGKWFKMLESYALKKGIIQCLDGREKGSSSEIKLLGGELWTLTLEEFKNEYGSDKYNQLAEQMGIKKEIEIPGEGRYASAFCDELGDVYKSRNVLFYRGELREIVEIKRIPKVNDEGKKYVENGFVTVSPNRFVTLAEMFIKPFVTFYTKKGNRTSYRSMTQANASVALESPNFQNKLPVIARIFDIQIPVLHRKKLTFPKKGYDVRFGSWLPFNAPQIQRGVYTLEEAKKIIESIFEEFCFESEQDRIHAIAAFITPFMRGLFPKFSTRTPVFVYMANRERAGKDYCAGCSGILYEGTNIEEPAISNDEKYSNNNEEVKKKLMACLLQGKKRFHSANNKGLLNNTAFEGITTSEDWNDRILGKSSNITLSNEMDFSISGNLGIRLTPDLSNRSRTINLHLVDEDANARVFNNPRLHEWVFDNRGMIISALYTLVENWVENGMKPGSLPFTSFPEWARVVGGIMEAAGYDSPCRKESGAIIALDPDTEEMKLLFESCYAKCPNVWMERKEIVQIVEDDNIMPSLDFKNRSDQTKFGIKIDKFKHRKLSGILMEITEGVRSDHRKYIFSKIDDGKNLGTSRDLRDLSLPSAIVGNQDKKNIYIEQREVGPLSPMVPNLFPNLNPYDQSFLKVTENKVNEVIKPLPQMADLRKKYADIMKKESQDKVPKQREKTDRELQFWESPETKDIVSQCTKEQTLEWVRNNPKISFDIMYKTLGIGSFKHIVHLIEEGLVRPAEAGWEVCNE